MDSISDLIKHNWPVLMRPVFPQDSVGFRKLVRIGRDAWFTERLKRGAVLDTGEPEFLVNSLQKIGKPVEFITPIVGYYGFFKYDIKRVKAIAPLDANAYIFAGDIGIVSDNEGNPRHHRVLVQFYRAEIDASRRLIGEDELLHDYEKLMSLIIK